MPEAQHDKIAWRDGAGGAHKRAVHLPLTPSRQGRGAPKGVTLVELVLVIVIIGILAAVAGPRFFSRGAFEARGFFDEALAAVRYAHKLAIASGCDVRVTFSGGYALKQRANCTTGSFDTDVRHPGTGQAFARTAPSGVAVGSADFYYDAGGQPRNPATGAELTTQTTVSIGSRTLTVEHVTGFAHP